jgi:hypothetical protein
MNNTITRVIEELINDIIFLYPETSYKTAEVAAATMIRYPGLLIELAAMVKDKRSELIKNI